MTDPLYHLTWLSRPLMQQVETAVESGLQGTGLTVRTRAVMEVLLQGPLTVPALAEALHIQRQYVQVMVNEALAAGFVSKQANPRHARSHLIALTPNGSALIEHVMAQEHALLAELVGDLPADEVATALRIVKTLITRFQSHNQGLTP